MVPTTIATGRSTKAWASTVSQMRTEIYTATQRILSSRAPTPPAFSFHLQLPQKEAQHPLAELVIAIHV